MFYSHTFLARKGPLGTVWCAAHLQHKLKKSHYTSTNITSTVERIMFPEVPIALRMSGHLLLGVVRIYSKKVDYLYQDYNVFLISLSKAFSSEKINLPEDADVAPFQSVTLPYTYELDAIDLDYDIFYEGNEDNNLGSFDEITLSKGRDYYINFDEELRRSSNLDNASGLGPVRMEEENTYPETMNDGPVPEIPSAEPINDYFNEIIPEVEGLCENVTVFRDSLNDVIPPDTFLEQQINNDKEPPTSVVEEKEIPFVREVPISPQHSRVPVNSPISARVADVLLFSNSLGHESLNLELGPSPPVEKPKRRPRKRKQGYDEVTVLTNKVMKAALDNCSDIQRKRKGCPASDLDVWKSNSKLRKETIFSEPLITGLAKGLRDMYGDNFISSKPHLKDAHGEPSVAQFSPLLETRSSPVPQIPEPTNVLYEEIEVPRNYDGPVDYNIMPDGMNDRVLNSPTERNDFTPAGGSSVGSTQVGTRDMASSGTVGSDIGSPFTIVDYPGFGNTGLSTIPEDMGMATDDYLNFLASEDYTPTNFKRTEGISSFSGVTRKVAQYLKQKYSPVAEDLDGDLSLNQLLEGKTRKVCARMFFETLVLKSGGLVDVQQEEAYSDIKLKLTNKIFKE